MDGKMTLDPAMVSTDSNDRLVVKRSALRRVHIPRGSIPKRALQAAHDVVSFLECTRNSISNQGGKGGDRPAGV